MGYFLTAKSRIEQTDIEDYWKLIDNELYMDNQGAISLVPRRFYTDGYTYPNILLPFTGDKHKLDVRPAHGHDLCCRFHERIFVTISLTQLRMKGYLHQHRNMIVCEDLPERYLSIEKIDKRTADDLLREMMLSCNIDKKTCNIIRLGVIFNFNWRKMGTKSLTEYNIFNEDIGLVSGA